MGTSYKIHVKIGDSEFSAEGTEALVKEQYDRFLEIVGNKPAADRSRPSDQKPNSNGNGIAPPPRDKLSRLFEVDGNGLVSLRILPRTDNRDADALLLILYGFKTQADKADVNSGQLMVAAKQSGLQMDRIDRVIAVHKQYVTDGGFKRGKRYGLNNQGVNKAQDLINGLEI
jgi:hypothetical protein